MVKTRDWSTQWQAVCGRGRIETVLHNEQMVRGFIKRYGARELDHITPLDALQWAAESPGSVRYVKLMFADARRAGLITASPFAEVARSDGPGRSKIDPPSLEVLRALAASARPAFGRAILFSAFTGLRLNETAHVEARDVQQVPDVCVHVRVPKRPGEPRTVGVYALGERAIADALADSGGGLLFPTKSGRRMRRDGVCREWGALCASHGVAYTWHQLRHFCATWLLDQGASSEDVALQLGHVDGGTLVRLRYGHPSTEKAVDRLRRLTA